MEAGDNQKRVMPGVQIRDVVMIFAAITALHITILLRYPIIYGGDTIIRLVNFPKILVGYQLPLFQVLLHYTLLAFHHPLAVWMLMALVTAAGASGLYALTQQLGGDRRAALLAAVFYATHPFIVLYSRVPYQEPLLWAALAWGFYYLFRPPSTRNLVLSSVWIGVACLTRYEGWIGAAAAVSYHIWRTQESRGKLRLRHVVQSAVLFAWAPILWLAWNRGVSPAGTYVVDWGSELARLYRPYFVMKSALWWTDSAVILMSLLGLALTWANVRALKENGSHATLAGFSILFLGALIFSAHGIKPDPVRLVTEREAYVPIALLILYSGLGGSRLAGELTRLLDHAPRLRHGLLVLALVLIAVFGLNRGIHRVAAANEDPEVKTSFEVAQFLSTKQAPALILARPLPEDQLRFHLDRAEKSGGAKGRETAIRMLHETETTPFDYQRVLAFSWMGRERILSGDRFRNLEASSWEKFVRERQIEYLVIFDDFVPAQNHERLLSSYAERRDPEIEIRNGNKGARIYRLSTEH
jgi:Dolichyl-phosphate-mannose-protein mannosyltransferase